MTRRDRPFDSIVNDPKNFSVFFVEFVGFAVAGALLGVAIDFASTKAYVALAGPDATTRRVAWARLASAALQIVMNALVVWVLWRHVYRSFVEHFQVTLPGMAFVVTFFGTQWNITYGAQAFVPYPSIA